MQKIWYVKLNDKIEGPFTYTDLRKDRRLTPDTLVWKQGFDRWMAIREVPELEDLFKDDPQPDENQLKKAKTPADDLLVLEMKGQQPPYFFWFLVAVTILLYSFLYLYWFR